LGFPRRGRGRPRAKLALQSAARNAAGRRLNKRRMPCAR
jgi:hypothetical protein